MKVCLCSFSRILAAKLRPGVEIKLIWICTDNAIPIEGWISDPTDNDLLNLIPILEGLQYSTDVRALLSLRLGQPQLEG
jgi:hypothetical protein